MNLRDMHPALSEAYMASVNGWKSGKTRTITMTDHESRLLVIKIRSSERSSTRLGKYVYTSVALNGDTISLLAADLIVRAYHKDDAA